MTTTHANSTRDAFSRLETMVMMATQNVPDVVIRQMLAAALQIVIHCSRLTDGSRKITGISEVLAWKMVIWTCRTSSYWNARASEPMEGSKGGLSPPGSARARWSA